MEESELEERVFVELAEFTGVKREHLSLRTRLSEDAGIAGDDGVEFFEHLDEVFEMEWTGLDLGVHFGNEGLGAPMPWQLATNCEMFEPQSLTVSDLVHAIHAERWPGSMKIPVSPGRRLFVAFFSWAQFVLLIVVPLLLFLCMALMVAT